MYIKKYIHARKMVLGAALALGSLLSPLGALATDNALQMPAVTLPDAPLHSVGTKDKPTITLALSVEFPTIGALYRNGTQNTDDSYSPDIEYIGYFYSKGCYQYLLAPTGLPAGAATKDYKRFQFVAESATRSCTGEQFSGNFLNWAASSSIDILRLALSGGDRYIDKDGLTVLQRAVVPAGTPYLSCLWNHLKFFPAKKLANSKMAGAVPAAMATKAGSNDLWIANRNNGIYFNKYASGANPAIRDWGNACDIAGEVKQYEDFLKEDTATSGGTSNAVNSDGFYYARVEVCTKNANGAVADHRDFGLCTQQPNGNFKPTGVIQKHANNLRIAALAYTLDHDINRYGGVLRAPMRYVGAKNFNSVGREIPGGNPYAEWDPYTGVLHANPHRTTDATLASWPTSGNVSSGVINYLNKFGRMGSTVAEGPTQDGTAEHHFGEYKRNDPVASLYHQALRYLQGLSSVPEATANLNNKHHDGFPIYKDWSNLDPFGDGRSNADNYACMKNNIIVIGDIASQENSGWKTVAGDNATRRAIDFNAWRKKAIDYESANFSNAGVGANDKNKLIGYAYWAHAKDIRGTDWTEQPSKQRPGLRVKTFTFDVNEDGASSALATRSKSNQFFLASKYGGYETDPSNQDENFYSENEFPNKGYDPQGATRTLVTTNAIWQRRPDSEKYTNASSMAYDAATYYLQSDARAVLRAFDDIFDRATSGAQSISQTSSSTSSINATTDSHIYTGTYDMASWTGNIVAKRLVVDATTKNVTLQEDAAFDPAKNLLTRASATRNIVMGLGGTAGAENFVWSALQGTTVGDFLRKASLSATVMDDLGEARVNYLRGDRALEGTTVDGVDFRTRQSLLGDIINAGVSYSGSPSKAFTGKSYKKFLELHQNRLPIVITGANDGMLHAFAAKASGETIKSGDEMFAYIPSWMAPKLSSLTSPDYPDHHQSYVDAPSAIGEAQFAFTAADGDASEWKTVLVSGTGAGGRGVFALDITSPTAFDKTKALWEFTSDDDADMGYVVSKPKILKFKTGVNTYQWFAVVASGVNNYNSNYEVGQGSGVPTIFMLALNKSSGSAWALGTNYFKISFPLDATLAADMAPGVIDFSTLWDKDGSVTHIYAGDLHGNLWKMDFTDPATTSKYKPKTSWNMTALSSFKKGNPSVAYPFYRAQRTVATVTTRQPISAAPLLVQGPVVQGKETFYVAFGTGKYLENSDVANTAKQSFYVLFDNGTIDADDVSSNAESIITPGNSRLQAATVNRTNQTISVPGFIWGRPKTDEEAVAQKSGWYFDFPDDAERMIYAATDMGQFDISFNSVVPGHNQTTPTACSTDEATSNMYDINIRTGGGRYRVSQIGILGPSLFLENEEKTQTSAIDSTGRAKRTIVREEIASGTSGHAVRSASSTEVVGRLSWRQLYNYKELKHSSTPAAVTPSATNTTTSAP